MAGRKQRVEPAPVVHKDGTVRWRVRFRLTPQSNPVSETFDDQGDAIKFANLVNVAGGAAARKARDASKDGTGRSLNTAFDAYLVHAKTNAQPDTLAKYRSDWERRIAPRFGTWPLEAISRTAVEEWVGELRETPTEASHKAMEADEDSMPDYLAPKSIANLHGLLSAVFKFEVMMGRLGINPAYGIQLPQKRKKREPVFLSQGQFATVLASVDVKWQPLVSFLAGTGLRWSEATALTPEDFNFDVTPATVRVSKAWKRGGAGEGWTIGSPKTVQGNRTVSMSPSVSKAVLPRVEATDRGARVFPSVQGKRLRGEWFHKSVWKPALEKAKLARVPVIHDLRHTHASWLIAQGVPLTLIQRRLGHSSISVTSDIYGDLQPDHFAVTAEATEIAMTLAMPQIEP